MEPVGLRLCETFLTISTFNALGMRGPDVPDPLTLTLKHRLTVCAMEGRAKDGFEV